MTIDSPNRTAFRKWRLLACLFIFSAGLVFAHDPFSSWSSAQLRADRLELKIELATESAWLFLNGTLDTAPKVEGSLPRLQSRAAEAYQLSIDKQILLPREASVAMRAEDGVEIRLVFDRPSSGTLHFDALYLKSLASNHRTSLTILDEDGKALRSEILSAANSVVDIAFPPMVSATSALVTATTSPVMPTNPVVSFHEFIKLGIEHILTGYDHLLFLLGLLVVCRRVSSMMLIITCFTLAHSLTLALAALNVVSIPSRVVEPLIAASIIFVGIENLVRRGEPKGRWLLTFVFGLIHGFGFASVLREVGLGAGGASLFVPLFSFNLGVEMGQLAVVAIALPVLWFLRKRPLFACYGESAISFVVLLLGSYWLLQRTMS